MSKQKPNRSALYDRLLKAINKVGIGSIIILFSTLVFFAPLLAKIGTYSEGGDALFNAWTLARNHNCLLGRCDSYVDGNIYYPNEDTMLYSETQLSTGLLTLPLYFIDDNPVFSHNVWKILSTFLSGWFMYLLVKRLSKGSEFFATAAGLVFAFAPFKMTALGHLQNLSIFYLPLIILMLLCYLDTNKKRYIIGFFISMVLLFYASWYQMVFVLFGLAVLMLSLLVNKLYAFKQLFFVGCVIMVAILTTVPLAKEYIRFSQNTNDSSFTIGEQTSYSSSVADYFIPELGTPIGKTYDAIAPNAARRIPYNPDSVSYHGITLYALAVAIVLYHLRNKRSRKTTQYAWIKTWISIGFIGFLFSLGPLLKVGGNYIYATLDSGVGLSIPLPYLLLDFALPQIQFIRAVGRWSALFLFVLAVLLAYVPNYVNSVKWLKSRKKTVYLLLGALLIFELAPLHFHYMSNAPHTHSVRPSPVHTFIKNSETVDNIIVIYSDPEYPAQGIAFARIETVLWAGYHNKNIFNGYSGYTPPNYEEAFADFVDLEKDDRIKMTELGLEYVLVDKQLSTSNPGIADTSKEIFNEVVFEDERHLLVRI